MANVKFERGLEDDVTTEIPTDGHLYVGTDTGNMYLGKNDGTKLPIGQADWNQTDATKSDFIKNKPEIPKENVYHEGDNVSIRQLPTQGYTRLKTAYNSNNSTYISTGVSLLNTEEIELEIRFRPQNQSTVIPRLLGRTGGARPRYWFGLFSTTKATNYDPPSAYTFKMFVRDKNEGYLDSGVTPVKGHIYLVRGTLNSNVATLYVLDETTGEDTFVTGTFSPYLADLNICLFPNTYNSSNHMASNTEVFHAVIRKNGEKCIEYIPFKRNSDDAVGFINTVNGNFVEATKGQFNAGATAAIEDYIVSVPDIPSPASMPPLMDSETASVGTSTDYARANHVHQSDTSRVPTTRKVNNKALSADITLTAADVGALPIGTVIPTVGTLNTDNTSAQSVNASESLGGTVKLHKVAKTGTYGDLLGKPTIPDINTALYKGVYTSSAVSGGQGLLVKTTLKANTAVFPMFHIIGRHHGGGKLIDTYVTFYNYVSDNTKMFGPSVLHCGRNIGEIHAFVYNPDDTTSPTTGYIYIWIPTVLRYNTYHVYCRMYNSETNCVDTITKAAMFDETLVSRHSVITPYVSAMTTDVPDDANLVHLTGNETIAGTKTFTGAVVVPTPTANTHAATKKYIDDIVGDIETLLAAI